MTHPEDTRTASQVRSSPMFSWSEAQADQEESGRRRPLHRQGVHDKAATTATPGGTAVLAAEIESAVISPPAALIMHGRAVDGSVMSICEHEGGMVAAMEKVSPGSDASLHDVGEVGRKQQLQRCQLWDMVRALAVLAALAAAVMLVITQGQVCMCVCDLSSHFRSSCCCTYTAVYVYSMSFATPISFAALISKQSTVVDLYQRVFRVYPGTPVARQNVSCML